MPSQDPQKGTNGPSSQGQAKPSAGLRLLSLVKSRWILVGAGTGLLGLLALAGTLYFTRPLANRPLPHEVADEAESHPVAETQSETRNSPKRVDLDEIDLNIHSGHYELALAVCKPAAESAVAALRDALAYRQALCLEGLGRWDDSLRAYRTVSSRSDSQLLLPAAQLGQARVWLRMGRPAQAKPLLSDLALRSADPILADQPLLADAGYLLGLALALEALGTERSGLETDAPVSHAASDWPIDRALSWASLVADQNTQPAKEVAADQVLAKRVGKGDEDIQVQIVAHDTTVAAVLAQLADQGKLTLEWSAHARQLVEERTLLIHLHPLPLPDFLRLLGNRLALSWKCQQGKLLLFSQEEMPAEGADTRKLAQAQRALDEAILHHPGHPLSPVAYLERGNLEAKNGRLNEAMAWYSRLIRELSRSPMVTEAYFNRGLLQRQAGRLALARQTFYRVVDRAPGHQLAPRAYYLIGRLYLDEDQPEQSLSPLRRALMTSRDSSFQPLVVITMAAAYLLTNNPRAANRTIFENRGLVSKPEFRPAAAFLDSLARFRACTDRRLKKRETHDLVTALLSLHSAEFLGSAGVLLQAQAFLDLGMHEQLLGMGKKALPGLRGPLAVEMSAVLAEACLATGDRTGAARYYAAVAESPNRQAVVARMRLAEISLADRQYVQCLKWCQRLLLDKSPTDPGTILRLMAGAYEGLGERNKAILCLSGKPPLPGNEADHSSRKGSR